jgi:SAM-dependent methyltransferase
MSRSKVAPVDVDVLTNTVPCGICGSDRFTVVYPPGVAQINQVVKCLDCGLMYASPRRDSGDAMLSADEREYRFSEEHPQRYEKEQTQLGDTADTRALLDRLHPNRGKAIEIGSSCGFQLDAFRSQGWDVLGIEPDRNAAAQAEADLSIPTLNTILEEADLPDESVDVVVMLHVIEHIPDPVGTLTEICRVLRPGGHFVLETPRYDTLTFKLLGRRERSVSCDGHIFFFTTDSLRNAYTRAGFELEKLDYVGRTMTLDRLAYNLGVMSKSPALKQGAIDAARRLNLQKHSIKLNARDMQRVCLVKPPRRPASGG